MWGGEVITYDRNLLYEQVWADPVQTVAKSYGVSGVYLARICRQLSVPLPPRGYWAKVRAGVFVNPIVDHRDSPKVDHPSLSLTLAS